MQVYINPTKPITLRMRGMASARMVDYERNEREGGRYG